MCPNTFLCAPGAAHTRTYIAVGTQKAHTHTRTYIKTLAKRTAHTSHPVSHKSQIYHLIRTYIAFLYVQSLFGVWAPANDVCAVSVRCMCASKLCMCGLCSHVFVRLCMCGMYVRRGGTIIVSDCWHYHREHYHRECSVYIYIYICISKYYLMSLACREFEVR